MKNNELKRIETYLDYLYQLDYRERPVSVEEFLSSNRFFGKMTAQGKMVYPIWKQKLSELLAEDSKYLVIFTGAIGTGKTRAAVWATGYLMYRILCLKDPWQFFNKSAGGRMSIAFFNLTKTLGESRAFNILQQHLLSSPWFLSKGTVVGKGSSQKLDIPLFDYALSSPLCAGFGTQGRDIIIAIMDEVDSPSVSEKQKQKVLAAYETTVLRFESRFVDEVYRESIGKFFLVASKQEQQSFLDAFIAEHKNSKNTYIADIKYWETKEKGTYCGKTFSVMLGDAYTASRIIDDPQEVIQVQKQGFQIIEVPIEFRESFERNLDGSLRDIAGVSTVSSRRSKLFPVERVLFDCYDKTKPDPANLTTITIGLNDELDLIRFLDLSKIRTPSSIKRFIHCDISYSGDGDALSIAMSAIKDWIKKDIETPDGSFERRSVPIIETDFAIRLKGKPGDEIPLYRIRKFILDLRSAGFNIFFTADLALLSADTKQLLERAGIPCDYLSLDRTPDAYLAFKELVLEKRWICHWLPILHFELSNLEYDKDKQKIDHPHKVQTIEFLPDGSSREMVVLGSKDMSDAVAGSVYSALQASPSPPLEKESLKTIMNSVTNFSSIEAAKEYDWVLEKSQGDQYLLQDPEGLFWIWTRENAALPPTLRGPFKEKLLNLVPIQVTNPAAFSGTIKPSVPSSKETLGKLSIFKTIRGF